MAQKPVATDPRYGAAVAVALAVALLLLVGAGVRAQPGTSDFDVPGAAAAPAAGRTGGIPPAGAAGSPAERQASQGAIVVVQPGDTVWDLARAAAPAGVAVEDYVDDVVVLNDVDPHHLVPGSTLRLP